MHPLPSLLSLGLVLGLAACGGGYEGTPLPADNSSQALAVAGPAQLTLIPSELKRFDVSGGARPYTVSSQNTAVALASVSDGTLTIAAVRGNTAPVTVTVADARNAKVAMTVRVTNDPTLGSVTLSTRDVALAPGANKTLTVTSGVAPFTVEARHPHIATATVSGNVVTVFGISEGVDAELRVIDSQGAVQTALVSVAAPLPSTSGLALFTNVPTNLALKPNTSQTFTLGGGAGPYTVTSSHPAVVNTTLREAALTLNARAGGTASLTITDNNGQTLVQNVRVLNSSAPLTLSSSAVSGMVGTGTTVGIAGGRPPYRAAITPASQVGTATIVNGDSLQITYGFVGGPIGVSVWDADNNRADLAVTATPVLSNMTVSPSRILVSELLTQSVAGVAQQTRIPLVFVNGRPPLQVFTSHPTLLTPTVNGNLVTVSTPGTVTAPIAPCVDQATEVYITGIDATGAVASATVVVVDTGTCPI